MSPFDEAEAEALERAEHGASEQSSGSGVSEATREQEVATPPRRDSAPAAAGQKPALSRRKKPTLTIVLVRPDPPEAA